MFEVGFCLVLIAAPPSFTIHLSNEHVDLNSDLTWRCIAEGVPEVKYVWYRNSEVIDPTRLDLDPKFTGR